LPGASFSYPELLFFSFRGFPLEVFHFFGVEILTELILYYSSPMLRAQLFDPVLLWRYVKCDLIKEKQKIKHLTIDN